MKKRGRGRPKIDNPKNAILQVCMTKDQYKKLKDISIKTGIPMSEIAIKGIKLKLIEIGEKDF